MEWTTRVVSQSGAWMLSRIKLFYNCAVLLAINQCTWLTAPKMSRSLVYKSI